ncbi:hypothetical protein RclHR1_11000004 [Rhizophagus clarus]|nr:hypothetical protein RclHR1_11000004 [Rhizophagus clarus]
MLSSHEQWEEYEKENVARGITNMLLQEIKLNTFHKISNGSENCLVDLMIHVFFRNKWEEIIYIESGKWNCNDEKIRNDHNKLVQLCMDGSNELFKICEKERLNRNYIVFGVNIAGECIEIYGLVCEKGVKYYFPASRAKIPFRKESAEEIEGFIHALLTLQNVIIVNIQAIANSLRKRCRKNSERSPTHKGEENF